MCAIEDVVAKSERDAIATDEVAADQEGLRKAVRSRLCGVGNRQPEVAAVVQQALERILLMRRGNDENFSNARQHQGGERVVNKRLVVDRDQLLAQTLGQRMEPRAGPA